MPWFPFRLVLASGIACLPGLAGCASDSEVRDRNSKASAPAQASLPESNPAPKKADLPDLPPGAGPLDVDAPEEFSRTKSGLYYRILRKSTGRKPYSVDRVVAHYKGWLNNGTQFDSSYDRGEPTEFSLRNVVPGWTEGLQLIGEGGMIELEVPPRLGYGAQVQRGIPPNSTLHFLVELKEIK
ncbi:MAG: FKBP-type peptidyl-prolyl cis-trans isomerase [Deltaproteobacteria bacterium]